MTPKQLVTRSAAAASLILLGSIAAHADDDIRELEDLTVTSDLREDTSADELAGIPCLIACRLHRPGDQGK